jgi:hypothetical protein
MSYTIIHIPIKSSSNEIKSFIVVFILLQLTLAKKIVVCSVLLIIKIFIIEDH